MQKITSLILAGLLSSVEYSSYLPSVVSNSVSSYRVRSVQTRGYRFCSLKSRSNRRKAKRRNK